MTVQAAFPSFLQGSKMGKCITKTRSSFSCCISHLARGAAALFPVASLFACTLLQRLPRQLSVAGKRCFPKGTAVIRGRETVFPEGRTYTSQATCAVPFPGTNPPAPLKGEFCICIFLWAYPCPVCVAPVIGVTMGYGYLQPEYPQHWQNHPRRPDSRGAHPVYHPAGRTG